MADLQANLYERAQLMVSLSSNDKKCAFRRIDFAVLVNDKKKCFLKVNEFPFNRI